MHLRTDRVSLCTLDTTLLAQLRLHTSFHQAFANFFFNKNEIFWEKNENEIFWEKMKTRFFGT